ncbi:unnamed protein product [Rangifer tarandus platyrhynchus]|uniref:Uncharacterized protein n=2 Tax=Rangifer tarandus platyrhynchus TaxID=3082113 RepID=A0ABN8ZFR4_RANTA|nr:unnamed protein product [Rangifer tarandus platyrhynchus]CAI9707545.1 unnamed protein product [Rangifer tarandus platyrhynchus]
MVSHPGAHSPDTKPGTARRGLCTHGNGVCVDTGEVHDLPVRTRLPDTVQSKEPGAAVCPKRRTGQCSMGPPVQMLGCHGPPAAAPSIWTPCRPPGALRQGMAPPQASRWASPGPGTGSSTLARGPRDSLHTVPTMRLGQKTPYSVMSFNTHRAPSNDLSGLGPAWKQWHVVEVKLPRGDFASSTEAPCLESEPCLRNSSAAFTARGHPTVEAHPSSGPAAAPTARLLTQAAVPWTSHESSPRSCLTGPPASLATRSSSQKGPALPCSGAVNTLPSFTAHVGLWFCGVVSQLAHPS